MLHQQQLSVCEACDLLLQVVVLKSGMTAITGLPRNSEGVCHLHHDQAGSPQDAD